MTGLVVSNQRGGVGKTTTAINYAGYLARQNQRVLLIDADSQGSINSYLGLKPTRFIANLIVNKEPFTQCVTPYGPTVSEVAHFIRVQAARIGRLRGIENPMGLLIRQVPRCFEGQSFRQFREAKRQRREAERRQAEEVRLEAEQLLRDPGASEAENQT